MGDFSADPLTSAWLIPSKSCRGKLSWIALFEMNYACPLAVAMLAPGIPESRDPAQASIVGLILSMIVVGGR